MEKGIIPELLAEIKVSYSLKVKPRDRVKVQSSREVVAVLRVIWPEGTIEMCETMHIILLNRAGRILGWFKHTVGGINQTVSDSRIIFSVALKCLATSLIMAHNHPSGNTQPSTSDIDLTKKIVEAGKLLEITVLDHIILSVDSFYSFADEGLI